MGNISIKVSALDESEDKLKKLSQNVENIENRFASIAHSLDWDVRSKQRITTDIKNLKDELTEIVKNLRKLGEFTGSTKRNYEQADKEIELILNTIQNNYMIKGIGLGKLGYKGLGVDCILDIDTITYMDESRNNKQSNTDNEKMGSQKEKGYIEKSLNQIVLGNFTDDVTLLGTGGQIGLGLLGVDLPCDLRDISADFINWEWSWGHVGREDTPRLSWSITCYWGNQVRR